MEFYVYVYLDPRKSGSYNYKGIELGYEPIYVGMGKGDRYLSHIKENKETTKNKLKYNKINKIINDGYEPIIIKLYENLSREEVVNIEIDFIETFGKIINGGCLTNIADGGFGGVTWIGEHHNKGKKLEEIVGPDKAIILKNNLSEQSKLRLGELNSNYGNGGKISGELHFNYGRKRSYKTKNKISDTLKKYYDNLPDFMKKELWEKQQESRDNKSDKEKMETYSKISKALKGREFSDEHKEKLSKRHYKKINKGSEKLKLSEEHKEKISLAQKGKKLSEEHINKLRKYYNYKEWKEMIIKFIVDNKIKTISDYRNRCKDIDNKMPPKPEASFKRHNWEGWGAYKKYFKK